MISHYSIAKWHTRGWTCHAVVRLLAGRWNANEVAPRVEWGELGQLTIEKCEQTDRQLYLSRKHVLVRRQGGDRKEAKV